MPLLSILYLFLCVVVGFLGRKTALGFWINLIISIFFTPIIALVYVIIAQSASSKKKSK
jgi:hypothetical protein